MTNPLEAKDKDWCWEPLENNSRQIDGEITKYLTKNGAQKDAKVGFLEGFGLFLRLKVCSILHTMTCGFAYDDMPTLIHRLFCHNSFQTDEEMRANKSAWGDTHQLACAIRWLNKKDKITVLNCIAKTQQAGRVRNAEEYEIMRQANPDKVNTLFDIRTRKIELLVGQVILFSQPEEKNELIGSLFSDKPHRYEISELLQDLGHASKSSPPHKKEDLRGNFLNG